MFSHSPHIVPIIMNKGLFRRVYSLSEITAEDDFIFCFCLPAVILHTLSYLHTNVSPILLSPDSISIEPCEEFLSLSLICEEKIVDPDHFKFQ